MFRENFAHMHDLVAEMAARAALIQQDGAEEARAYQPGGRLLPRERLADMLDVGSPFLETGQFTAWDPRRNKATAGVITGIGRVEGCECMLVVNDATVNRTIYDPLTVKKHLRAQEIALENNLPCIYLVDSGGADPINQNEAFPDKDYFGQIFYNQAILSARGVPQIACVMGSCSAGSAYIPAMSDETVIVRSHSAVTGSDETGDADHYAQNDRHALSIVRRIVRNLNRKKALQLAVQKTIPPLYDPHELYGIVPPDLRQPYDVCEVIARIVDGSVFDEFKRNDGATLITGFAHLYGMPVGILANNGVLSSESALKGARFIELCCQRKIPLLFLQNVMGFTGERKDEIGGITKNNARLIMAVATARVPKITTIIGGSFGAASYGMCSRAFSPRFLWTWPNARISMMTGDEAVTVLSTAKRKEMEGAETVWTDEEETEFQASIQEKHERESHPLHASARLWNDGIIDPAKTRETLALSLSASLNAPIEETGTGIWRMQDRLCFDR